MLEDIKNHKPVKLLEYLLHFWYSAKKSIVYIFNHDNTGRLIISLLNNVIEKELKLGKQNVKTDEWLSNLCKAVKTKHWPIQLAFFLKQKNKNTQNTLAMKKNSEKNKKHTIIIESEFVIFLTLGVLWWKLKILIDNFSHVSPNRFWRIFSMLLNIAIQQLNGFEKYSIAISLMLNHNLTGLFM